MIHYEKALFEYSVFKNNKFRAEEISNVHSVKKKVLSLPIYPELTQEEIKYICKQINEFFKSC